MRRTLAFLLTLAVFILTSGFQIKTPIPLKTTATVTLSTNEDATTTFELIARAAGLNVVFARGFGTSTPMNFRVENMSASGALDLLSRQTGTFWVPWDSGTILVARDNEGNRRAYERVFVATIALPGRQDPKPVLAGLKGAVAVGDIIVLRDTLSGIEKAAQFIATLSDSNSRTEPALLGSTNDIFLSQDGPSLRSTASKRSQLRTSPREVSMNLTSTIRSIYENLGSMSGLNVMFGRNFPTRTSTFRAENVGFFEALDLLAVESGTFWQPIDEKTIQVIDETLQNRRDFELRNLEVIYLPEGTTAQRLNEITNALRTVLALRGVYLYEPRKAIVLHDTPANLLLVEDLIATLERVPTLSKVVVTDATEGFSLVGVPIHSASATRSLLKVKSLDSLSLNQPAEVRTVYESIAQAAGLSVVFGPRFQARSVAVDFGDRDAIDALDLLARQSGTFWQPVDEHTILVFDDTQQNRRDYETHAVKTILLPTRTTPEQMNSLINVLRTALSLRGVYQSSIAKAIVLHDTPSRVAIVEKLIRGLIPNPNAIVSLTVPAPGFAETKFFSTASSARSQLSLTNSAPISVQVNQDSRLLYETLAGLGGIKVNFHPQFSPGDAMPRQLDGVDLPDALDRLSLQTGNYWTVVDSKTILVAPDSAQIRQQYEQQVSRTVSLKTFTQGLAADLVNVLRTVLSMKDVETNGAYSITMKDSPQRIAIAEQVIANLDRP